MKCLSIKKLPGFLLLFILQLLFFDNHLNGQSEVRCSVNPFIVGKKISVHEYIYLKSEFGISFREQDFNKILLENFNINLLKNMGKSVHIGIALSIFQLNSKLGTYHEMGIPSFTFNATDYSNMEIEESSYALAFILEKRFFRNEILFAHATAGYSFFRANIRTDKIYNNRSDKSDLRRIHSSSTTFNEVPVYGLRIGARIGKSDIKFTPSAGYTFYHSRRYDTFDIRNNMFDIGLGFSYKF